MRNAGRPPLAGLKHRRLTKLIFTVAFFGLLLAAGNHGAALGKASARVGILPFQVYSGEKVTYLQEVVSAGLAKQLEKRGLVTLDQQEITRMTAGKGHGALDVQEIEGIARKSGSDYLVYGSLTKIDDNLSIDARLFAFSDGNALYKDYAEGKDLDRLIENLGAKISQRIIKATSKSAPQVPGEEANVREEELEPNASPEKPASITEQGGLPPAPPRTVAREPEPVKEASLTVSPDRVGTRETPILPSPSPVPEASPAEKTEEESSAPGQAGSRSESFFPKMEKQSSPQPINITSDRMEADNRNRTVNFLGNVVAKRDDMVIFSDRILTYYTKDGKMDKIVAQGNVKINQNDRMATCSEATFFQPSQKIVLTGKPKVWQGSNIITGETITILLKEDKVDIAGSKQTRVNATIYPMGTKKSAK